MEKKADKRVVTEVDRWGVTRVVGGFVTVPVVGEDSCDCEMCQWADEMEREETK